MAASVTKKDIQGMPIILYTDLRPKINNGDILFCSGNYTISKMIQAGTHSPWSHVGIFFWAKEIDRLMLLESVEDMGVRLVPASKYTDNYEDNAAYNGELVVGRHDDTAARNIAVMANKGFSEITQPYNKMEIVEILGRIMLNTCSSPVSSNHSYICSELVDYCYHKVNISLRHNQKGFITPDDIWRDDKINIVSRIH